MIGLPWYGVMAYQHGLEYLANFFIGDNLERFATDRFNPPRPIWFYVPIVVGGLLPWAMFLLVLPWSGVRNLVRRTRQLSQTEWQLLVWAAAPLLFFTISIGKQPRYILPVLPPLVILVARAMARRIAAGGVQRGLGTATWATAALFAVLAFLLWRARPLFIVAYPLVTNLGLAMLTGSAAALGVLAALRRWDRLPVTLAVCGVALILTFQFGALSGIRPEPVEEMATLVGRHRPAGESIGVYRVLMRNLVFYTGTRQVDLFEPDAAARFLTSPDRVLLVVRASDLPHLEALGGVTTRRLGEVEYVDPATIRIGTLIAPDPDEAIETVVLVANR